MRIWYGIEEFGGNIVFTIGNSARNLELLKKAIEDVNTQIIAFTNNARIFNESVGKFSNLSVLVKAIEDLAASKAKQTSIDEEINKKAIDANEIRKKLISTLLQENKVYGKQNQLLKEQAVGLDASGKKIKVNANAKGQLLSISTKSVIQTEAQIKAQKRLSDQYARATENFAALNNLRIRGLLKELSITPRLSKDGRTLIETWRGLDSQGKAFTATVTKMNGQIVSVAGNLPTLDRNMQATKKSLAEFTLSWKTMIRLIAAQAIRRVLFAFVSQTKEAIDRAVEFSVRIAEVRTISQQNQLATSEWAKSLRELSDSFGIDLLNQTEAAYQTLSNQVAHGAEVFGFLEEANKLAVATVSDSATAVQFLSAIQNAYNLSLKDTREIAAKAFKVVELGRVRLDEMANTIGQLAVPAKLLNISFSELGASIAVITNRGIPFNESQTLLRNLMLSLIKPTKDMKELLRGMGFETGEAAIKTLGWAGVLGEIEKRTQGSSTEIAKLVRRIRGTVSAMVFSGKGLEDYKDRWEKLENAQKSYGVATREVLESAGKVIQIEVEKIKNFFTQDIAKDFVEALAYVNKNIISLTTVVKGFSSVVGAALVPAIGAAIYWGGAWVLALNPITLALTAIAAATLATVAAINNQAKAIEESSRTIEKEYDKQIKASEEKNKKLVDDTFKTYKEIERVALRAISNVRKENFKLVDDQLNLDKRISKGISSAYANITKALNTGLKGIKDSLKEANNIITGATQNIVSLRRELEQKQFEAILGKITDPAKQISLIQERIKNLKLRTVDIGIDKESIAKAEQAFKDIASLYSRIDQIQKLSNSNIGKEIQLREKIKRIDEDIAKARRKAYTDELKDLAKIRRVSKDGAIGITTRDGETIVDAGTNIGAKAINEDRLRKQEDAELKINRLIAKRNDLVNQLTKSEEQSKNISKNKIDIQQAQLNLIKEQIKFQEEVVRKETLEAKKREVQLEQRKAVIKDIHDAYLNILDISATGLVKQGDLEKQKKDIEDALVAIDNFQKKLNANSNAIDLTARKNLEEEIYKRKVQLTNLLLANENSQKLKYLEEETKKRLSTIDEEKKKLQSQLDTSSKRITGLSQAIRESVKSLVERGLGSSFEQTKIVEKLNKVLKDTNISTINDLETTLRKYEKFAKERETSLFGVTPQATPSVDLIVKSIVTLHALQKKSTDLNRDLIAKGDESKRKLQELKDLMVKANPNIVLNDQLKVQRESKFTLTQILKELQDMNTRGIVTKALGGRIGTDSIPAMLSPGEFIMNAKSTRKFYSQLVAMNAPNNFARGGLVTNVGDINVTMASSGNENYDVTKFGKLLRRQIRHGTLKLN